jgi:hypothetical protein
MCGTTNLAASSQPTLLVVTYEVFDEDQLMAGFVQVFGRRH